MTAQICAAPTRLPATFVDGTLDGKWSYLPEGARTYTSPTGERYELLDTVWHSEEDDVMSHQVYRLAAVPSGPDQGELRLGAGAGSPRSAVHGSEPRGRGGKGSARGR